jgi:tetratricopeptide (TPR) repeat protein
MRKITKDYEMKLQLLINLAVAVSLCSAYAVAAETPVIGALVSVSEGTLDIPTYEHTGRELEPLLFESSTVKGLYPFPSYLAQFQDDSPKVKTYRTILVENEYLKLTYIPELGGRFFSLYDKVRKKEVFYRNDVIKPTMFNPRFDWPQSGIELTGPYDTHTLTLHGEPFWSNTVVRHPDGSVSLVLGELDPVYHTKVNLSATLYPGIAAMQISVFCYNRNDGQIPQMFWTNASFPSTEKTRFIYPMTRTVGHTTGEVSDWPLYNNIDYSWDRNNKHMLGVFGIDAYDNFAGSYQFDNDYGVFRYADRRLVQGMKMWTFGYGPGAELVQQGYTDHAGPYVEVQSGRHVWDGHYEWVAPDKVENWSEWWIPVGGIGGLTTMTRDVALNLTTQPDPARNNSVVELALSPTRVLRGAKLVVTARYGELLNTYIDLVPGTPVSKTIDGIKTNADGLTGLTVRVMDSSGREVMNYLRPDENPGRKQYSPFAKALDNPQKSPEQMGVEELVQAAEFKLKEMNPGAMQNLVDRALKLDPGYSLAHLLLGVNHYNSGRYKEAAEELSKATERDPYLDEGWYYLAISQLALGDTAGAERNLYYIEPESAYFGEREYQLGKLAFLADKSNDAVEHFDRAIIANGYDLNARALYALTLRSQGRKEEAKQQLAELLRIDPTDRLVYAERFFLNGDEDAKRELIRLMGEQSQEAIDVASFYGGVHRWSEAAEVMRMVERDNHDPWGTSPLYYYTLAYYLKGSGDGSSATEYLKKAQAAREIVDRFPYRRESEAPLVEAVMADPRDDIARFNLGCLLYFLRRQDEAIAQWQSAIAIDPRNFSARRALGLAYADQGKTDEAARQLEKAVNLRPDDVRALNDLSSTYARSGKFDDQIALLNKAIRRTPNDDDFVMALMNAYLIKGRYQDADAIVNTHKFAPLHRSTVLRDEYRYLRYGMGAVAFNKDDYSQALSLFQSALKPPVSLGIDDFQFQSTPRAYYYIARAFEALGRKEEAAAAYRQSMSGVDLLSGDRDSWNSENFFAVLSLEKLGQADKANTLIPHFEDFAKTEMDDIDPAYRGKARYLLALIEKRAGHSEQARKYMNDSLQALPDSLQPRYELRGDAIDPLETGRRY